MPIIAVFGPMRERSSAASCSQIVSASGSGFTEIQAAVSLKYCSRINWAATESMAFLPAADFVLLPLSRLSASTEENLSSTRATGRRNLPSSCRANRSTRRASACSPRSATGSPTTRLLGCHWLTRRDIESNPGAAIAGRGCAVPSSGSPTATPMRFRPKSKARTVCTACPAVRAPRSGMSRFVLQRREVEAEELHRRRQAFLGGRFEDDRVVRFDGEPGVLRDLVLQLTGGPPGVAQRDQHPLRALAASDRLENVLGGREPDRFADAQGRLPAAGGRVQDEAAIGLHRSAEVDRRVGEFAVAHPERQPLEEGLQRHVDRPVHYQAERAPLVVLA